MQLRLETIARCLLMWQNLDAGWCVTDAEFRFMGLFKQMWSKRDAMRWSHFGPPSQTPRVGKLSSLSRQIRRLWHRSWSFCRICGIGEIKNPRFFIVFKTHFMVLKTFRSGKWIWWWFALHPCYIQNLPTCSIVCVFTYELAAFGDRVINLMSITTNQGTYSALDYFMKDTL